MFFPFAEYRPDVDDFNGDHTQVLFGVLPRGDGYGPFANLNPYTLALPAACRGFFYARKTDGTIVIFAGTVNRLYRLDNTTLDWVPVSKVTALTSISNGTPAVFTLNSHGLSNGARLVLSTSNTLPTGLTVGTVYYVVNTAANTFNVSLTSGGTAVNTSGAGSGTHSMTYFYTDLASTDQWQFAQFGNNVVAVMSNTVPQVFDISSGSRRLPISAAALRQRAISRWSVASRAERACQQSYQGAVVRSRRHHDMDGGNGLFQLCRSA
jgi:hypothetical protein